MNRNYITKKIFNDIIPIINDNLLSVFLVGASLSNENSMRMKIYKKLKKEKRISIYFPERLMVEVFYSHKTDYLSLENLLANNVNCVTMCIESPGSIAELGAFANHKLLRNKLLVIMDEKFKNDRSGLSTLFSTLFSRTLTSYILQG